jgi:2-keto-3-deoxy-L-rhamnonate aldolase RhmA
MSLDHHSNVIDHPTALSRPAASAARNAKPNSMKQQLKQGKVVSAMSIRYSRGVEVVGFAKAAGMQGVLVDLEHSSIDLDQCMQFTLAALAHRITPVVRVPSTACSFVGRVLDGGAQAVIIPHVRTAQDALDAARAAKFFPDGDRSAIGGLAALQYGSYPTIEANMAANEQVMCIIMIETLESLENLDEIASTPNVDVLLIGTNDMSACLGAPGDHDDERITEIYERVISACRKNGKAIGIGGLYARQDLIDKFIHMASGLGRFIMCGSDQDYVLEGARRTAKWLETYNS